MIFAKGQKSIRHGVYIAKSKECFKKDKQSETGKFKFNELANKEVIGHGSYGIVYKTSYLGKTVVVKNILGESAAEQNSFVKEARLIKSLQHKNVVAFIGFCSEPYAMMLEYVYFDFLPFEISKKVSNLVDFLNFAMKVIWKKDGRHTRKCQ